MAIKVLISGPLRKYTDNLDVIELSPATVNEIIGRLCSKYHGLKNIMYSPNGQLSRFVKIFINNENIELINGMDTFAKDGAEIVIIRAIAGG